jgi:hypothetical protein
MFVTSAAPLHTQSLLIQTAVQRHLHYERVPIHWTGAHP